MKMRIPVIASVVGGLVEIIGHEETGIFLDELSPKAIAQAIEKIENDSSLRENMIDKAESFAMKFDGREQLRQLVEIYEQYAK